MSRGPTDPITADDLVAGIANALAARDMTAVVDMLEALAVVDLDRAAQVHDAIAAGLAVARVLNG